ncbi:MAG: hypothetical protein KA297_18215 [Kofleriaceae bacterium]|nr:hypothetical protein [Kofleriaceae bacterium]MBP6836055.1 hypothetical protein [Kofleriaceae bacterium]
MKAAWGLVVLTLLGVGCRRDRPAATETARAAPSADAAGAITHPGPSALAVTVELAVTGPPGLDPARLEAAVRDGLLAAPGVTAGSSAGGVASPARVVLQLGYDVDPDAGRVLMTVEGQVRVVGQDRQVGARAAGERATDPGGWLGPARALADALTSVVTTELAAKLTLWLGDDAALGARAAGDDLELAAWAFELAADRRSRVAWTAALARVRGPGRVAAAATEYLVALGDPAAMSAIAGAADFSDRAALAAAIEAAAVLGGDDAEMFLELLASGGTEADTRARAAEALVRLRRRGPGPDAAAAVSR